MNMSEEIYTIFLEVLKQTDSLNTDVKGKHQNFVLPKKQLRIRKLEFEASVWFGSIICMFGILDKINIFNHFSLYKLAWEPSIAQSTHNYSSRLPALGRKLRFDPLNIPHGSPEFPHQNLRQIGQGVHDLWSDLQTNKHPNRVYNFIYIKYMDGLDIMFMHGYFLDYMDMDEMDIF